MMKTSVLMLIVGACGSAASGQTVVDQENIADFAAGLAYIGTGSPAQVAQEFKQTNGNISGASIQLGSFWGSDTVTLGIYTGDPYLGGTLVSGAIGTGSGSPGSWIDVFWPAVSITPGASYWLGVEGTTGGGVVCYTTPGSVYPSGGWHYYGTDYTESYDMGFKTWYDVPAPGAAALLGLGGLAAARRRRR